MFRDVVILIPGILGSVLERNGSEVWGASTGTVLSALTSRGRSLEPLRMQGDDWTRDDVDDGVVAMRLLPDMHLIPGLWKVDGYGRISRALVDELGLVAGANYFEFPYDWRRDLRAAARHLERSARDWLGRWRTRSGNDDARLVLVAHSMGGLVARHFVEVLGGWRSTAFLATFGTPFRGSPKALSAIANGLRYGLASLQLADLTDVVRSFESVYQLLPTYRCWIDGDRGLRRLTEVDVAASNVDPDRLARAHRFHADIAAAQAENAREPDYRSSLRVLPFIGIRQGTAVFGRSGRPCVELVRRHRGSDVGGDGTVPTPSALPAEWDGDDGAVFLAQAHASLQNDDAAFAHLRGVLEGRGIDYASFRTTHAAAIGVDMEDAYAAGDVIELRAVPETHLPALSYNIVDAVTGDARASGLLLPHHGAWRDRLTLPTGAYRITVGHPHARDVTDVFAVI